MLTGALGHADPVAFFQAHRGGLEEAPENTMAALMKAWAIPGSVPEVDLRTTADGQIICLHDATLARTSDAARPISTTPVSKLTLAEVQSCDVGVRFDPTFSGERVPTLRDVFTALNESSDRQVYLDLKDVSPEGLRSIIEEFGVIDRVIFVHGDPVECVALQAAYPGCRTMTWISGSAEKIVARYEELAKGGFKGISQLQFHLQVTADDPIVYALDDAFLARAVKETGEAGAVLQVRPFKFDGASLKRLVDLGIHWFVADAPDRFYRALSSGD